MSVSSIPNILKDSIQDSFLKLSWNKEGKEVIELYYNPISSRS